jgi:hypothetical protein
LLYTIIGIVTLGIGFYFGYSVKKKVINDIPGVRRYKVKDFFVLYPLLKTITKRLENTVKEIDKESDMDDWLEKQLTLPEIRVMIKCGIKDPNIDVDELDYKQAFELFRKVRKVNADFFTEALRAIMATNLI